MPYARADSIESPDDWSSNVWRYLSTSQLLSILETDKLHFTRTDQFPDPYEGDLPDEVLESMGQSRSPEASSGGDLPDQLFKDEDGDIAYAKAYDSADPHNSVTTFKKSFFHNSWNYKDYESKPMWDNKSKDGEGVAIRTTAENLRKCFQQYPRDVYIGLVEYGDYTGSNESATGTMVDMDDWKNVHLHKPIEFEEENELRATVSVLPTPEADPVNDFSQYSRGEYIDLNWSTQPTGVGVSIDKQTLIQEIRLSPYADDWQKGVVEGVLEEYGIDARVTTSNIYE